VADLGFVTIRNKRNLDGPLYFQIVRQVAKLLANKKLGPQLWTEIEEIAGFRVSAWDESEKALSIEEMPSLERHQLLSGAAVLMHPWPDRFISVCNRRDFRSTEIFRDVGPDAPYAFSHPLLGATFKGSYAPNPAEIDLARKWLVTHGRTSTRRGAKRYISSANHIPQE
jgi:hypothetical protein